MSNYILYIYISLLSLVGFVPYFGSIDIIGPQWFYLSLINLFVSPFILSKKIFYKHYLVLINKISLPYLIFILFTILSLFFSLNLSLSLVEISRVFIVFISIYYVSFLLLNSNFNFTNLSLIVSSILFLEVLYSFYPLIVYLTQFPISELNVTNLSSNLKGVSGNVNVLSANIVFKLGFLFFLFFKSKNIYLKLSSSFLLTFSYLLIFLLASRTAFISLCLISFLFFFHGIFSSNISKYKSLTFIFLISISIALTSLFPSSTGSVSSKFTNTALTETSLGSRIYLYQNVIDYLYFNPITPIGIGNWKIESLLFWKTRMTGYVVPYHAHNDFLELTVEIGILGGLSYFLFFVSTFLHSLIFYFKQKNIIFVLIFSLCVVYFFDAMLNFPLERALSQVNFILLASFSISFFKLYNEKNT